VRALWAQINIVRVNLAIGWFLCSSFLATASRGEYWRLASLHGSPHPTIIWLLDADTLRRSGTVVRFWLDVRDREVDAQGSNRTLQLIEANCADQSYEGLQTETYFAGTPLRDVGRMSRSFAAPGTIIGGIIGRACAGDYSSPISPKNDPDELTRLLFGDGWFNKPVPRKRSYKPYYSH
jgi:hypothetical protein